ncbi:antibiotic biosynthesis monooxygenase [Stagnimonas aquatica]|uniref:Antibiotic biosynthesis monooxygenase n=1 Tax=Stagnimonas aquatica TaxID=2689987 RepID=A0A3N0VF37_9GAMM|nr:antibiotic biosynthesis monooxygenase [Stagnimonas aquatica]ROH90908.1 antibiotic biosynthesis monooxygenase [Stagnimonas aquatica]
MASASVHPPASLSDAAAPQFAVLYQWSVKPGEVRNFVAAWTELTERIRVRFGSGGSRLHRSMQGTWIAYAQWPSQAASEAMSELLSQEGPLDPALRDRFLATIDDTWAPVLLSVHKDLLS